MGRQHYMHAFDLANPVMRPGFEDYAKPAEDGDLSHLPLDDGEVVPAGMGYLLSPDCVHESMIQPSAIQRTFLRIALPVDFNF
jgi:hypothetical protein